VTAASGVSLAAAAAAEWANGRGEKSYADIPTRLEMPVSRCRQPAECGG
jgi:hypothetical protein